MALISDVNYALQAIRLSSLRATDDPLTPRIITLDPSFALNPYINASGLSDIDRWPEIKRALDSPPLERPSFPDYIYADGSGGETSGGTSRRGLRYTQTIMGGRTGGAGMRVTGRVDDALGKSRREARLNGGSNKNQRTMSSSAASSGEVLSSRVLSNQREGTIIDQTRPSQRVSGVSGTSGNPDEVFALFSRPRADSAPAPILLQPPSQPPTALGTSMITSGHGLGFTSNPMRVMEELPPAIEVALSVSETSMDGLGGRSTQAGGGGGGVGSGIGTALEDAGGTENGATPGDPSLSLMETGTGGYEPEDSSIGITGSIALPSQMGMTVGDGGFRGPELADVDEGSDVDPEEAIDDDFDPITRRVRNLAHRRVSAIPEEDRRSSTDTAAGGGNPPIEELVFNRVTIPQLSLPTNDSPETNFTSTSPTSASTISGAIKPKPKSALTALLHQHVPHLISTSDTSDGSPSNHPPSGPLNPFASLYASVAAPATVPSLTLEIYFPHSEEPSKPLIVKVRKDATVEEVTGHGLWKYWDEGREPRLGDVSGGGSEGDVKLTTIGWGLRIVEDDGEVDEDFPPLDRESSIAKFSYGQFAIVEATASQIRQNAAKAPTIQRRPSRIIAEININRPRHPNLPPLPNVNNDTNTNVTGTGVPISTSTSSDEALPIGVGVGGAGIGTGTKSGVGFSSAGSRQVLLRVRVSISADVHFTTTISVPADMYIADLTEVLHAKKRLPNAASDWVLCLADLTLALPLDRTVASLEGITDLALVRRQWAAAHGLRPGDRRGGDPSASIFSKRVSEPAPLGRFGPGFVDFSQTYKKYIVQRKTPIGRHERILAIDGDYIHIMPSETRAIFDSMKTTSIHITLVASCKLSGRGGGFKIYVWRDGYQKRYEFEAENGKQAGEIIASIRQLMNMYRSERSEMAHAVPPQKLSSSRR